MGAPPPPRGGEEEGHGTGGGSLSHPCMGHPPINATPLETLEAIRRELDQEMVDGLATLESGLDWDNLNLLHHTALRLEAVTRQSASQISTLRNQLDDKDRQVSQLRDQLRTQEARERNLVEQNRALRLQIMSVTAVAAGPQQPPPALPLRAGIDIGIQVNLLSTLVSTTSRGYALPSFLGGSSPQPRQPFPGSTPLPESPTTAQRGGEEPSIRLEAPSTLSRLPQGQGQIERPMPTPGLLGAGGILSHSEPAIDRQHFLTWRRRRRLARRYSAELLGLRRHISLPRVRPLIKRRNGLSHGGGEVVGYRWTHFSRHEFLRDPYHPPNPFLEEEEDDEEEEEESEEEEDEDGEEVENEEEDMEEGEVEEEEEEESEEEEEEEELSDEEDDEEMGEPEVIDVIDLVDDDDDEEVESEKKPLNNSLLPKVEGCEAEAGQEPTSQEPEAQPTKSRSPTRIRDAAKELKPKSPGKSKSVEVPQWRQLVFEPIVREEQRPSDSESLEEMEVEVEEDISEVALLRRHARLELDEKRRKRWDSQRAREETYLEKLKRKMEERENQRFSTGRRKVSGAGRKASGKGKAAKNSSIISGGSGIAPGGAGANGVVPSVSSTTSKASGVKGKSKSGSVLPGAAPKDENNKNKETADEGEGSGGAGKSKEEIDDDILYVRVAEDIPISIFGYPLPAIEKTDFELPWIPVGFPVAEKAASANNQNCPVPIPPPDVPPVLLSIKMEPHPPGPSVKTETDPQPLSSPVPNSPMEANVNVMVKPEPELALNLISSSSAENPTLPVEGVSDTIESRLPPTSTSPMNLTSAPTVVSLLLSPTRVLSSDGQQQQQPREAPDSPLLGSLLANNTTISFLRR